MASALVGRACTLTSLGDVFNGSDLDRLLRSTAWLSHRSTSGSATRRCGCRTCGASDFYFVADMLGQLRSISGQLKAGTALVG
jgi:hypothetical protein